MGGGMEGSMLQGMMNNPEVLRSMLQANPAIREVKLHHSLSACLAVNLRLNKRLLNLFNSIPPHEMLIP